MPEFSRFRRRTLNIAEHDDALAKKYGIAELNNGQDLNASFPYTKSALAKILDMGS